jgi:outer membrane protein
MKRSPCIRVAAGLALACYAAWPLAASGEVTTPISVAQAIERAVASNPDLRRERVAVAQAAARELAAEGQFDVVLDAGLSIKRDLVPPLSCTALCQDLPLAQSTTTTFGLGLARGLESGGTLRLAALASRAVSDATADSGLLSGTYYQSGVSLTFAHPLLRGFGTEVALANLRKMRIQHDAAQLGRQMRACIVLRDVIVAYWELAYATQDLTIRRSALALAEEQLRITQALIAVGRLADADAASVERAIAQRQEDVATGEQVLFFRSLDLQRLLGQPAAPASPSLAATDVPATGALRVDEAAEIDRALEANPQLRALKLGLVLSQTDLATARSTLRPRLDFMGSVGPAGFKPGFGDSLKQTTGLSALTWSAGLAFELPVENRTARGQLRVTEEDLNLAHLNAEDFALQLRDLILRTARSIHTAGTRTTLGQREVEFARQNLDAEHARFQAGRATNNDVLLRQQELKDAETRLLRATVDQNESEAALAAASAEILDRYDVVLK